MINPTGGKVRGHDVQGDGQYGAPRGSGKTHVGTDYIGVPGQLVYATIDGIVSKIGYVYSDDLSYNYVTVTNDNHVVRHLYVEPKSGINRVLAGDVIGTLQALHPRYRGIINHVHIDIRIDGQLVNPEDLIL